MYTVKRNVRHGKGLSAEHDVFGNVAKMELAL
jgi:hypothetical protein